MKKKYKLEVTYVNPKDGSQFTKIVGPVFSQKVLHDIYLKMIGKRNVISITTMED